jgi:hypothetical protein
MVAKMEMITILHFFFFGRVFSRDLLGLFGAYKNYRKTVRREAWDIGFPFPEIIGHSRSHKYSPKIHSDFRRFNRTWAASGVVEWVFKSLPERTRNRL